MPEKTTPDHDHIPDGFPFIVAYYALPAAGNRPAQTVVKFSDDTRIAVNADGERVKVGRDHATLAAEDVERFNFGPGREPGGSVASAFVNLGFVDRDDAPDRRTVHRGHDHPTTKAARARCRRDAG